MKTKEQIESEFKADFQALVDKYRAEIHIKDYWEGYSECGEDIKCMVTIGAVFDESEYCDFDLGTYHTPRPHDVIKPKNNNGDLSVWYGKMPESNGKTNWTAMLYKKGDGILGGMEDGFTIDRSEYEDRVRYEADRVRYLIGEIDKKPWILDYDSEKHSGYVAPEKPDEYRNGFEDAAKLFSVEIPNSIETADQFYDWLHELNAVDKISDDANEELEKYLESIGGADSDAWHDYPTSKIFVDGFKRGKLASTLILAEVDLVLHGWVGHELTKHYGEGITSHDTRRAAKTVLSVLEKIKQKDNCEICHGEKGGVLGNENIIDGKRVCDYCHAGGSYKKTDIEITFDELGSWHTFLPKITPEIFDFIGTDAEQLIEVLPDGTWNWTQTAVDFCCTIPVKEPAHKIPPGYAMIPVDPTSEMINKIDSVRNDCLVSEEIYKVVLSAGKIGTNNHE